MLAQRSNINFSDHEQTAIQRFASSLVNPDKALEALATYTQSLEKSMRRQTVLSFVKLFGQLRCSDTDLAFDLFWDLLADTLEDRLRYASRVLFRESLATKFLQALVGLSFEGDGTALLRTLVDRKRTLALFRIPERELLGIMNQAFRSYISERGELVAGITVVHSPSSEDPHGDLGRVIYAVDEQGRWYGKLRISEYELNGLGEFECGFMAQDPRIAPTPKRQKGGRFPGARRPGLGLDTTRTMLRGVITLAAHYGISVIDLSSQYYHLSYIARMLGADYDSAHHRYNSDRSLTEYFEQELDRLHIGQQYDESAGQWKKSAHYLAERSWYVYSGQVLDPQTGAPGLRWHYPRLVIRLTQTDDTALVGDTGFHQVRAQNLPMSSATS